MVLKLKKPSVSNFKIQNLQMSLGKKLGYNKLSSIPYFLYNFDLCLVKKVCLLNMSITNTLSNCYFHQQYWDPSTILE